MTRPATRPSLLRLSEKCTTQLDGASLDPDTEESLVGYLERMRQCAEQLEGGGLSLPTLAGSSLELARALLPLHLPVVRAMLGRYHSECRAILRRTVRGGGGEDAFWRAIGALNLYIHVESELLAELKKFGQARVKGMAGGTFAEFWDQFKQDHLEALLATISPPKDWAIRWEDLTFASLRDCYVEYRAGRVFDYILDYPESEAPLAELKASLSYLGSLTIASEAINSPFIHRLFPSQVETVDILGQLAISIPVINLLDPTGFLLGQLVRRLKPLIRYGGLCCRGTLLTRLGCGRMESA